MNLLKQALLCSCLLLSRLGGLAVTSPGLQYRHVEERCGSSVLLLRVVFLPYYFTANTKGWWKHLSDYEAVSLERKTGRRNLISTEGLKPTKHSLSSCSCSFFLHWCLCSSLLSF